MTNESVKKISALELYAVEIATLNAMTQRDAAARRGSFSERNPQLGKPKRCPYCHQRVRDGVRTGTVSFMTGKGLVETEYSLPCCNGKLTDSAVSPDYEHTPAFISSSKWKWSQERMQWEIEPRAKGELTHGQYESILGSRRRKPRLSRNKPPLFEMHDLIMRLEGEEDLHTAGEIQDRIEGLPGFWTPQNTVKREHLATFAEKVISRKKKDLARSKRKQQQLARRINFGLVRER